jgi:hypothetical protein
MATLVCVNRHLSLCSITSLYILTAVRYVQEAALTAQFPKMSRKRTRSFVCFVTSISDSERFSSGGYFISTQTTFYKI